MCDKTPKKWLVAIDPGTTESGVCIIRTADKKPMFSDKIANELVFDSVMDWFDKNEYFINWISESVDVVIEKMQGTGMPVSTTVFETCYFIGSIATLFSEKCDIESHYIFRRDEYNTLLGNMYKHNDVGIRQSLVDMFAYGQPNYGKGTKQEKGWFYGFKADVWAAYSVGVTYLIKEYGI